MEPYRPQQPDVELLEDRPPGTLEQALSALLRYRWVRVAGVAAIALVVAVGFWSELSGDDSAPSAGADPDNAADPAPLDLGEYIPPPWATAGFGGWEVLGRPAVNPESPVYVVTFRAVNRSDVAQNPRNLRVVGTFAGDPGFAFLAMCTGFDNDAAGELRPVRSMVESGTQIEVRCADTMEYSGNRPELDRRSLEVQALSERAAVLER